ncbi:MAG: Apo-citrate lyase phosphoribosyl-dephospho-CoA transferase [Candidatus Dichloromethanomonas elyunquensis]|nr:MAG: Apo-citrate lyase phosphoribosyl-dephospho-CoA transferase [Candidatus Dichloromethanomonas elyunquensis]
MNSILNDREQRFNQILKISGYFRLPVLCGRTNFPGPEKNNGLTEKAFLALTETIQATFGAAAVYQNELGGADGQSIVMALVLDSLTAKKMAVKIEEDHLLGRMFDIDVYDEQGFPLGREALRKKPRKCLICGQEAKLCTRAQRHSVAEVRQAMAFLVKSYEESKKYYV